MENTAQRIKRLLNEHKGSWPEISRDSGVPYFTLAKIASGASENPRIKTCDALSRYFDAKATRKPIKRNAKNARFG